jgi:diguanylate cyclase (GGDEF)-like protein
VFKSVIQAINIFKDLNNDRDNDAFSQATIRLYASFIMLFLSIPFSLEVKTVVFLHTLYSLITLHRIKKRKTKAKSILILSMFVDISTISAALYFGGIDAIFVYPIYLWVIIGNGIRFGSKLFFLSLITSVTTFFLATRFDDSWKDFSSLSYSLTIGLGVLTILYMRVIKEIQDTNEFLDDKVSQRTKELKYEFYYDRLTNLKNKNALTNDMKSEFSSILLLDIDNFQSYNDLYGMEIGNKILVDFVTFLKNYAKKNNYEVYNIYTDGFVLRSRDKYANSEKIFEDINTIFKELSTKSTKVEINDQVVEIEIDITIAISMEKDNAVEKANIALKHAKKEQKKFIAYYKGLNMQKELEDILFWRKAIKDAIVEDRVVPLFQPIVDKNGKVIKYEALIRIKEIVDGSVNYISPFKFLDIAIQTKQYDNLTRIMIEKSFKIMSEHDVDFSINLLFSDIKNRDTVKFLKDSINRYNVGDRLILEIVESEDIKDYDTLKDFIQSIREQDVRIAIDDFGSGFSNFKYILDILPDFLKIDGSLIKDIDNDTSSYKLVSSISNLADSLGIKTIAEYVHNDTVFNICSKIDINEYQGYYFSPPIPEDEIEKFSKESFHSC